MGLVLLLLLVVLDLSLSGVLLLLSLLVGVDRVKGLHSVARATLLLLVVVVHSALTSVSVVAVEGQLQHVLLLLLPRRRRKEGVVVLWLQLVLLLLLLLLLRSLLIRRIVSSMVAKLLMLWVAWVLGRGCGLGGCVGAGLPGVASLRGRGACNACTPCWKAPQLALDVLNAVGVVIHAVVLLVRTRGHVGQAETCKPRAGNSVGDTKVSAPLEGSGDQKSAHGMTLKREMITADQS